MCEPRRFIRNPMARSNGGTSRSSARVFVPKHRRIWLQEFAYRDNLKIETFIAGSGVVIAIALITVVYQSLRAAYLNPVDALKSE